MQEAATFHPWEYALTTNPLVAVQITNDDLRMLIAGKAEMLAEFVEVGAAGTHDVMVLAQEIAELTGVLHKAFPAEDLVGLTLEQALGNNDDEDDGA